MPCMATCHCSLLASPQQLAHVHAWVCMLCERMLRHRVADRLESSYPAGCRATGPPALQLCHAAAYGASSCCAILPSANNGYTLQIKFRTSYFKKILKNFLWQPDTNIARRLGIASCHGVFTAMPLSWAQRAAPASSHRASASSQWHRCCRFGSRVWACMLSVKED